MEVPAGARHVEAVRGAGRLTHEQERVERGVEEKSALAGKELHRLWIFM